MKADLHMHSYYSDGHLSVEALVKRAKENKIDVIALTDHDTIDGIKEAMIEGEKAGIKVISGVELSTYYEGENIHILGYFKKGYEYQPALANFLKEQKENREKRAIQMAEKLKEHFNIDIDALALIAKTEGIITRSHIAQEILDSGYPATQQGLFETVLNEKSPAFIPSSRMHIEEGIRLLKSYHALPFLAHPIMYKQFSLQMIPSFGFAGIEAMYPLHDEAYQKTLLALAKRHNLFISAGSDYHGGADTKHHEIGTVYLTNPHIEALLDALNY